MGVCPPKQPKGRSLRFSRVLHLKMKQAKKFSALLIVFMLIVSCFSALSIPVLAASGDTIYFDNSVTNFSTVYCYMWNDSGKNGEWPGVQMTQGSDGIWSCSVAGDYNKVIFNAGQGQRQSSDLDYPGNNKVAKAQGNYDKFDVSWSNYSGGNNPTNPTSGGSGTVYLKDDAGWGTVYCYMWTSGPSDQNHAWPGEPMTSVGNGTYKYDYSGSFANVIFNPGGDDGKTSDLTFPGSGQMYNNSSGQWSAYSDNPTTPTNPTNPTNPTTPTEQTNPTTPTNPTDPTTAPTNPTNPTNPTDPVSDKLTASVKLNGTAVKSQEVSANTLTLLRVISLSPTRLPRTPISLTSRA